MKHNQQSIFRRFGLISAMVLGSGVAPAQAQIPCRYDVTVIQGPHCPPFGDPPVTTVTGLNELGHVCGYWRDCDDTGVHHPFIWTPEGEMVTIPIPPGVYSVQPADINDNDVICGTYSHNGFRGFVYDHGVWTELPPPFLQGSSSAAAINNAAVVCGMRSIGPAFTPYNAFIWSAKNGFTDLGVIDIISDARNISESGTIAGSTGGFIQPGQVGFVWSEGRVSILEEPMGSLWYSASKVNALGIIDGGATYPNPKGGSNITRGINWRGEEIVTLEPLPGYLSSGSFDLNDNGVIVGRCLNPGMTGQAVGVVWFNDSSILLTSLIETPVMINQGRRVNNDGVILAGGNVSGYPAGFVLTPVHSVTGDINCDGMVNTLDLGMLLVSWSIPPESPGCQGALNCSADLNGDGFVNTLDLGVLLSSWTL